MKRIACALSLALCSCSSSEPAAEGAQADEYFVDCTGTDAGTGVTSDENLAAFINAEAAGRVVDHNCKAPRLTGRAAGTTLSAQTPTPITFDDNSCGTAPIRSRTGLRKVPRQQPVYLRAMEALLARVSAEAQAHCGAISGTNYYFKVMPQNGTTPLYTAMLSVITFTPDPAKWQKALSGRNGQTVNIVIEGAVFFKGDIRSGPFRAQSTFTVGP
jgi:hypothetical protein